MALAPYVSVTGSALNSVPGPNVVLQGCNLNLRSTTSEDGTSGLGNLIVGWDDNPGDHGTHDERLALRIQQPGLRRRRCVAKLRSLRGRLRERDERPVRHKANVQRAKAETELCMVIPGGHRPKAVRLPTE